MLRAVSLNPVIDGKPIEFADPLELAESTQAVREQLAKLAPHERDAIEARAGITGRSYRMVAKSYGVSPQTISNWADAAERKVRPGLEAFR